MISLNTILSKWFGMPVMDHPFVIADEKPKAVVKTKKVVDRKPDNIVYTANIPFVKVDKPDGFECEVWNGATKERSKELTSFDLAIIKNGSGGKYQNLKEPKYRELKPFWSSELSAANTAKTFNNKRGYGQRTIETYFAAMNHAASLEHLKE